MRQRSLVVAQALVGARRGVGGGHSPRCHTPVAVKQWLDVLHLKLAWARRLSDDEPDSRHGVAKGRRHNGDLLRACDLPEPRRVFDNGKADAPDGVHNLGAAFHQL